MINSSTPSFGQLTATLLYSFSPHTKEDVRSLCSFFSASKRLQAVVEQVFQMIKEEEKDADKQLSLRSTKDLVKQFVKIRNLEIHYRFYTDRIRQIFLNSLKLNPNKHLVFACKSKSEEAIKQLLQDPALEEDTFIQAFHVMVARPNAAFYEFLCHPHFASISFDNQLFKQFLKAIVAFLTIPDVFFPAKPIAEAIELVLIRYPIDERLKIEAIRLVTKASPPGNKYLDQAFQPYLKPFSNINQNYRIETCLSSKLIEEVLFYIDSDTPRLVPSDFASLIQNHLKGTSTITDNDRQGLELFVVVCKGKLNPVKKALTDFSLQGTWWFNRALILAVKCQHFEIFNLLINDYRINPFAFDHRVFKILIEFSNSKSSIKLIQDRLKHWRWTFYTPSNNSNRFLNALAEETTFYSAELRSFLEDRTKDFSHKLDELELTHENTPSFIKHCKKELSSNPKYHQRYLISMVLEEIQLNHTIDSQLVLHAMHRLMSLEQQSLVATDAISPLFCQLLETFALYLKQHDPLRYYSPRLFYKIYHAYSEWYTHGVSQDEYSLDAQLIIRYLNDPNVDETGSGFEFLTHLLKEVMLAIDHIALYFDGDIRDHFILSHQIVIKSSSFNQRFVNACNLFARFSKSFVSKARDIRFPLLEQFLQDPLIDVSYDDYWAFRMICFHGDVKLAELFLPYLEERKNVPYQAFRAIALEQKHTALANLLKEEIEKK